MGSNMAEQHPVGFQWVIEAKERGAKVIHVDPRFTRTSAMADLHVPIRAGTDIAFLGGIVNYIFEHDAWFREYVRALHQRPGDHQARVQGHRGRERLLLRAGTRTTAPTASTPGATTRRRGEATAGKTEQTADVSGNQAHGAHGMKLKGGEPPDYDDSMQDERCVLQILAPPLRALHAGGRRRDLRLLARRRRSRVAQALCENSGRERTSAVVYSVGWTQHTVGVQNIRAASIVQLLLGNIGRPGGGILALRGHANIQGSTDIPTLYDILPGLHPDAPPAVAPDAGQVRRAQRPGHRRVG